MAVDNLTFEQKRQAFFDNEVIRSIAQNPKWTVSDKDKRPISLYLLFHGYGEGNPSGCVFGTPGDTMTLPDMLTRFKQEFPDAGELKNFAYMLDVLEDDIVVLDIEPSCSTSMKHELLSLPYLYAERSMSGKGYHLVFPKPENFGQFPEAAKKVALKSEDNTYEILLNHWVTFTGDVIPQTSDRTVSQKTFAAMYAKMAIRAKESDESTLSIDKESLKTDVKNIPDYDYIFEILTNSANDYRKTLEEHGNDRSRYEYGFIGYKYRKLLCILNLSAIKRNGHVYTPEERALILYEVATEQIPYRSKHDTMRGRNIPWLLSEAILIVERDTPESDPTAGKLKRKGDDTDETEQTAAATLQAEGPDDVS